MIRSAMLVAPLMGMILSTACRRDDSGRTSNEAPAPVSTPSPSANSAPSPASEGNVSTASGDYVVYYNSDVAPEPFPLNEMFSLDVRVEDKDGHALGPDDIRLRVDAAMPQHGHGMNTTTRTEPAESGFHVSGMLLHMPGDWKIFFDVTRKGRTDRATVDVSVE